MRIEYFENKSGDYIEQEIDINGVIALITILESKMEMNDVISIYAKKPWHKWKEIKVVSFCLHDGQLTYKGTQGINKKDIKKLKESAIKCYNEAVKQLKEKGE